MILVHRRWSLVLVMSLGAHIAHGDGLGPIRGAITESKPIFDARLRVEGVDQAPLAEEARATTLRLRLGVETGKAWNTALLVEGEGVVPLRDDYRPDGAQPGRAAYPVVADPEGYEINRLQLVNASLPGTTVTIGRQRILLDDQRFVGNSAWRQNEQTFDAVRIINKPLAPLTLDATYLNQVNRVFGPESPQGRYTGDGLLANISYQFPIGKVAAFGYALDFDPLTRFRGLTAAQAAALDPVRVSTETHGVRVNGERPLSRFKLAYAGSYAQQRDYGSNPFDFELDYYSVELTGTYRQYSLTLGQEVMQGNGTVGFSTPLATLHRFHGWADKFLTTPANGIDDRYVGLAYQTKGFWVLDTVSAALVYRDFESERRAIDLGEEIDVQVQAKYRRFLGMLKYANYDARAGVTPAAYQDTRKFWVQLEYVW
jgi:hypothetical protein